MVEAKHYFKNEQGRMQVDLSNKDEYIHYETTHLVDQTIIVGPEAEEAMQMRKIVKKNSYTGLYLYLYDPCGKHPTCLTSPGKLL